LTENRRREEEERSVLFVEPPSNVFPDDGEDQVSFDDIVKDPLEV